EATRRLSIRVPSSSRQLEPSFRNSASAIPPAMHITTSACQSQLRSETGLPKASCLDASAIGLLYEPLAYNFSEAVMCWHTITASEILRRPSAGVRGDAPNQNRSELAIDPDHRGHVLCAQR